MVVSSLIAVILEDEMSGYVGNRGMKTFILSCSTRQIHSGFFPHITQKLLGCSICMFSKWKGG